MSAMKEEDLLESSALRNQMIDRTEVLSKVKELFLLPGLGMMTTKQVADFYEVQTRIINQVMSRHRDEIMMDGVKKLTGLEALLQSEEAFGKLGISSYATTLPNGQQVTISSGNNFFYPPRAILRVGMLLQDSAIAKEVRTQLLNTFELTTAPQRTEAINQEDKLLLAIIHARDAAASATALADYKRFMERHVEALEAKVDDLESQLALIAKGTVKWGNRPIANALVRGIAAAQHAPVAYTWGRVYRQMEFALGIKLSTRKPVQGQSSLLSRIREAEWPAVLRLIGSLAYESRVDVALCINSTNEEMLSQLETDNRQPCSPPTQMKW